MSSEHLTVSEFPYGLMTKLSPTETPDGAALVSYDADYNSLNIASRKGYARVLENGPGAVKIADFEPGEAWSNSSAYTADFVLREVAADGTQARLVSVAAPAAVTASLTGLALNLGTNLNDVIHLWVKVIARPAGITSATVALRLETSGGNYYEVTAAADADLANELQLGAGKYHRFRRSAFVGTGAPDWTNITAIRLIVTAAGTGTFTVAFDNLHRTPGRVQDIFQFRRQSGVAAGSSDFYAVANGNLYRSDGFRWQSVFSGFDADRAVHSLSAQDRRLLTDGKTTPRVLMPDGVTVYRLGIVTPPKQMTATQIAGGGLPDGAYFAQVLFYSSKTGTFSAPDDRVPRNPIITIAGGGGTAGIHFANIPVSADPQVDYVVIGLRPDTEPSLFFRVSDGLHGEVANGTTTYDYQESYANLLARSLTAIDPDLDYPSVVDPATGLPVEAHPLFWAEAGGYILSVMAEKPTVVRTSRFRQPGSWAIDDEFPLGENDQESLTGIAVVQSLITAHKRNAVYPGRVVGGDEKIRFDPPISDRGSASQKGIAVVGQSIFYRALDGIYRTGLGLIPRKLSDLAQPTWRDLWDPYGIGSECTVPIRDSEQVVTFGRKSGALFNDTGWVTHYRTVGVERSAKVPQWAPSIWRMAADCATEVLPAAGDGGAWETWIGSMGQVWRITGGEDDGRPITLEHRTNLMSPDPANSYLWRFVDVEAACAGQVNMTVAVFLGTALIADASPTVPLQGGADVLGEFILGISRLGTPKYTMPRVQLPCTPARYISVGLSCRSRNRVEIYRVRSWYNRLGSRRVA
ncbi:MAG TPA: hypothetical protein VJV75_13345 [Candidatus Polarisedimenticolia bacterium]|nr:hypothetical protein [Candidatus Polarisedimenticolia bacterium]